MDHANNAGTKLGYQCSLILCEGLSAKTYAVAGMNKGIYGKEGRNWLGVLPLRGKCVSPNTPVIFWNGEIKEAKYVKIGDILVNDLGEPTTVLELFSGTDNMYEVQQIKGDNYSVNSEHTLTLKISGHCSINWYEKKNQWKLYYFDRKLMKMRNKTINCIKDNSEIPIIKDVSKFHCEINGCNYEYTNRSNLRRHYREIHNTNIYPKPKPYTVHNKSFITKEEGLKKITELLEFINTDNVIDISIKDYLKLDNETKHHLKGFKLNNYIKWEKKDVQMDPYILGMWLGDGLSNGYGFTGEDIELINEWYIWCLNNNGEIVHNNRDCFTIRQKNSIKRGGEHKRIPIGTVYTSNKDCRACKDKLTFACSNDHELLKNNKKRIINIVNYKPKEINGNNPLTEILKKYRVDKLDDLKSNLDKNMVRSTYETYVANTKISSPFKKQKVQEECLIF
jgi:hypothetical protein